MKKRLSLIMTMLLSMILMIGCSSEEENNENVLKVGMDLKFPPFTYMDENSNPAGLEVDIAYALGEYIGKEVEIVNTDYSMLIPALDQGEIDIVINDMSIKEERKEKVDFSDPYMYGRTLALVNKDFYEKNNISEDMTAEEFFKIDGARFVGLSGTIGTSVPQSYGVEVNEVTEVASGLMEIKNATADIWIGADTIRGDHASLSDETMIYENIPGASETAMAVKKGNTELLTKVNEFIATMYEDGGLYDTLAPKYDSLIGEYLQDSSLGLEYKTTKP